MATISLRPRRLGPPSVFDAAQAPDAPPAAATTAGFGLWFRTTPRDRQPPREILTPRLMGDPAPDRVVPVLPPETRQGHRDPDPARVYLRFRDYEAALANGSYVHGR